MTGCLLDYEESDLPEDASKGRWWSHLGAQSDNGILLEVETETEEREKRSVVTEVLLYAAVTKTKTALPTPPASSSPVPPDENPEDTLDQDGHTIKVFALPLCSNSIRPAKEFMEVCSASRKRFQSAGQACFLPHVKDSAQVTQLVPQKRQSISALFEDATKKRGKLKRRGGESISQAMAGIDRLPSHSGLPEKQEAPQLQQNELRGMSLSRPSSIAPVTSPEFPRPVSRSGPLANGKRSSLHRVESADCLRDSPMPSDADGSHAQQNKVALTKVIMAALRLHGLQQKKKPASKSQLPDQVALHTEASAVANETEDEYKLVYHQTFRAALFTFRKYLNVVLVSQETMRDVVDRLLTMFCTDPMVVDGIPNGSKFGEIEANNGLPSSSPFDKPSGQAQFSNACNAWNTPTVKKR